MRDKPIYNRRKNVQTWIKENGLIRVEAYFEDPVHFIILTLLVNEETREIKDCDINFLRDPYPDLCHKTAQLYKKIIGLKIQPGFNKKVRERIPVIDGCLHVKTLLREAGDAIAQSGFYTSTGLIDGSERRTYLRKEKELKNICYAYSDLNNPQDS